MYQGCRNALKLIVPNWLADIPGANTGFKVLYVAALMADAMIEDGLEGVYAAFGIATPTALPYVGASRGLVQGESESDSSFILRLVNWLRTWLNAGADAILAEQIQAYLGNFPLVRVVDRAGRWTTVDSSGNVTFVTAAWNWDGTSGFDAYPASVVLGNTAAPPWWSDLWIIVSPPEWPVQSVIAFPPDPIHGIGHSNTQVEADAILSLVQTWKGAHTFIRSIIWTYDSSKFTPTTPTADGNYGNWYKIVAGVAVEARDSSARYWEPLNGGG